jgi:HK97 family phage portal protein
MRHSAVWACLRLRADLISSFPCDVFRKVGSDRVQMSVPPVLQSPGGGDWDYIDWMYASQIDLDRCGNAIGIITEWNGLNLPGRIELQPISICSVISKADGSVKYRIHGKEYDSSQIWHERQFPVSGLPVGLSPVAYAAWTIGQYESAQQFAVDWYGSGGIPKAHLRNTEQAVMTQDTAVAAKSRFKASVEGRDVFVTGKDWEYKPIQAEMAGSDWLEAQRFGIGDVARFFGVPGNLIDAGASGEGVTYANVTQRNMQFLIMHLGPAVIRREKALSKLTPMPRFVKLNTDALLRMDPASRAIMQASRIAMRTLTVTEARQLEDLPPLTKEQIAEFVTLFGPAKAPPPVGLPKPGQPAPAPAPPPPPPAAKSNGKGTLMGDIKDRLLI